ncbi:hypothetical protein PSTG_08813 [Puccinia striiformis f. sp. tritici PST-78]|uniref:HMG box domain-containing protein n=1 Tax=Puccinia striiformis f. sp. tritici PST-78 TaxID=1165861 RepID=A0A0L0VF86_9BASI|nr:hypothetical protein PSTG_08813 [Puccinia striiformis f. sp. tritici PST-78]
MDPSALFKTNNSIFAPCALLSSSASVGAPSPSSSPITRSCSSPPRLSIDGALLGFNIGENLTSDDLIVPNAASNRIESPDGRAQGMVLRHQRGASTSEPAGEDDKPWRNCRKTANSAESQNGPTQSQLMTPEFKPTVPQVDLIDFGSIGEFHFNLGNEPDPTLSDPLTKNTELKKSKPKGTAKTKEEKLPRPPNSWILYRSDKIVEMKAEHKGLAQCLLSKEIATRWHNESKEVKNEYEKKAEVIKAEHAVKYPDYKYSPKRRRTAEINKDGQKKTAVPLSPIETSKRKASSSSAGPRSTASKPRKRKASGGTAQHKLGPIEDESKPELSNPGWTQPDASKADLFSSGPPPISQTTGTAQDIQTQRLFATDEDYRKSMSSIGPRSPEHPFNHRFSATSYGGLSEHELLENFLPPSQFMPVAQSQSEWLDYSRLDPQLQYDNPLTSLTVPSTSDWLTNTDISTQSLPNSAPSVLSMSSNRHQPVSPNLMDFGLFPGSDSLDFNRLDADWINSNPQDSFYESFLTQPFESSSYPSFGFTHQNPLQEELPDTNPLNQSNSFFPSQPYLNSHKTSD